MNIWEISLISNIFLISSGSFIISFIMIAWLSSTINMCVKYVYGGKKTSWTLRKFLVKKFISPPNKCDDDDACVVVNIFIPLCLVILWLFVFMIISFYDI